MKLYLKSLAFFLLIFFSFGSLAPFLFSAPSNLAVIGGLFYLTLVLPYLCYKLVMSMIKDLTK